MLTMFRHTLDEAILKETKESIYIPAATTSQCRLATGRSTLFHLIKQLDKKYTKNVLLPCYVAEGVIKPFLTAGFNILFYRLNEELSPLIEDLDILLGKVEGSAVVVLIHYFGFSAHSPELTSILDQYHPVVVDDCAHALFTTAPDGVHLSEGAELFLYSLNKFLPVVDGAILASNCPDINLTLEEETLYELSDEAQKAYQLHLKAGLDLFNCVNRDQAMYYQEKLGTYYQKYYEIINSELSQCRQSGRSKEIEETFPYDWLIENRLMNSHILYEELESSVFSLVHPVLPSGVVPWCIPVRIPAKRRDEIISTLFDQGILLSTLRDKWDFIPNNQRDHFVREVDFLEEHVLIPISEFIATDSMRNMVQRLNQF